MTDNSRVRVSIVGVVIVALFIALLARLWFLQMGAEEELRFQAVARSTRMVQTESPRGRILDRNGNVLVENVAEWAVTVDRTLDKDTRASHRSARRGARAAVHGRAAGTELQRPAPDPAQARDRRRRCARTGPDRHPRAHRELSGDEGPEAHGAALSAGSTRRARARVRRRDLRRATRERAATPATKRARTIGKDGAERAFEKELRGKPRREKVEVDPTGQPVGAPLDVDPGTIGNDVKLTIDASWQGAAELALAQGIESARQQQNENIKDKRFENLKAPGGAVVAMNVADGSVVAMASPPTTTRVSSSTASARPNGRRSTTTRITRSSTGPRRASTRPGRPSSSSARWP